MPMQIWRQSLQPLRKYHGWMRFMVSGCDSRNMIYSSAFYMRRQFDSFFSACVNQEVGNAQLKKAMLPALLLEIPITPLSTVSDSLTKATANTFLPKPRTKSSESLPKTYHAVHQELPAQRTYSFTITIW